MTIHIKQLPWWKWTLLLIGAFVLALLGYALIDFGYNKSCDQQHPSLTIISIVLVLGIYALIRGFRNEFPAELRLASLIPHTLLGQAIGFVYVILVFSTIVTLGGNADVSWQNFYWEGFIFYRDLGVAVAEVIIFIGVFFRMIDERWNTTAAFIVTALAFTIAYRGTEPPIVIGLMFAAAYKWSGTLWLPIGFHWAWNYMKHTNLCGTFQIIINDYSVFEPIDSDIVPIEIFELPSLSDRLYYEYISPISENIYAVIYAIFFTCIFLFLCYRRSRRKR